MTGLKFALAILAGLPSSIGRGGYWQADSLALVALLEDGDGLTVGQIRSALKTSQATASAMVARAARRGIVETRAGDDRRFTTVHMTAKTKQHRRRAAEKTLDRAAQHMETST